MMRPVQVPLGGHRPAITGKYRQFSVAYRLH